MSGGERGSLSDLPDVLTLEKAETGVTCVEKNEPVLSVVQACGRGNKCGFVSAASAWLGARSSRTRHPCGTHPQVKCY
jgi:hypothetical protein